jgi:sterol desaturase/sphingolipid hydroxylase (fatty acid hydroxylase superfamily)
MPELQSDLVLLALAPLFFLCVGWEAWHWQRRGQRKYEWRDATSNFALALLHQGADLAANYLFIRTVYTWLWERGLHAVPDGAWWSLPLAILLQDFLYYWFHRASHRIRWLWASHVTHHSSERLNLSTAFRQSLTYPLSGMWAFWLPLAWAGFTPDTILLVVGLNLAYQFWVHTEAVGKLGWLDHVINTPSVHRVHHARNPHYIDRNYAGVLVVWDKLFGTYVEESELPEFGIVEQVHSFNPLWLTFHEWVAMLRDAWRDRDPRHLWKPPEWRRAPRTDATPAGT